MSAAKFNPKNYSVPTRLLYGEPKSEEWDYSHHVVPPITASSTFRLGSAQRGAEGFLALGKYSERKGETPIYVYDRMGEPNTNLLQDALAVAEEGEVAFCFSTGMGAVHAGVGFALLPGSEVISHRTVYGCTYSLFSDSLARLNCKVFFTDMTKADSFLPLVNDNTRVLYLESPANPTLEMLDLDAIAVLVRDLNAKRPADRRIITVIDNTFSTPFCQRPLTHGIDVVVHSLTKGISGFGVDMGGAVITRKEFYDQIFRIRKDFGAALSPEVAWRILSYGLSTLALRVSRQQESAMKIARFLEAHPAVEYVRYPGLESFPWHDVARRMLCDYQGNFAPGFMIYFALKGQTPEDSRRRGRIMMDYIAEHAYCVTLAVSLGQLRTLIEHPGSMTHASYPAEEQVKRGMHPGGIRLAIGIEEADDLIQDLKQSLLAVQKGA